MDGKKVLLVVEDDKGLQKQFKWGFENYQVVIAGDREEAIAALRKHMPSVVTLDLGLPPDPANASEGLKTLEEILKLSPATKVIVVTGNDDRDNAVKAVATGAYDFYQKPVDLEVLNLIIARAFALDQLEKEKDKLQAKENEPLKGIIAVSPPMQKLTRMVEKIAPTTVTALLLGESGTGKEVFARAIHQFSDRKKKPFVAVNCAAIPENLLESELFGYEKGAFTGASKQTKGKIEYADGGTFFLDEIGDLPYPLQAKLLRFIQERKIERLGGRAEIPVDVRIICATHQHLETLIENGEFREDLFYRVGELVIDIPPLRERQGDAIVLAQYLLKKYVQENRKNIKGFTEEAEKAINAFAWPGNVRQLENKIKRAVIMCDGNQVTLEDIDIAPPENNSKDELPFNLKQVRENAETAAIKRAILYCDYNMSHTAKLLGITRPTLYALFEKYGIQDKSQK